MSYYRLFDEAFLKDDALVCPLKTFLDNDSALAYDAAGHGPPLVVEVTEDDADAIVLLAEDVAHGYFDVVERYKGRARGW